MKVVAIIQARTGSARLPNKVLLPLCDRPMLMQIVDRVSRATLLDQVVVTVPVKDVDALAPCKLSAMLHFYSGDENDLVARYIAAAEASEADIIVRIGADNPCVDPAYIDKAVEEYLNWQNPAMFYTNTTDSVGPFNVKVDGVGAEVFSVSRLKWLDYVCKTQDQDNPLVSRWREHPHTFFYDNRLAIAIKADIRLDVNTQSDYEFIKRIYEAIYPSNPHFTAEDVVTYLERKP